MIMGYRLVQAVLVVNLGRLGDMFGRSRSTTLASPCSPPPRSCSRSTRSTAAAALWLIGWRVLAARGAFPSLSAAHQRVLTGRQFFPGLISGPFHQGLAVVLAVAAVLAALAALASLLRGPHGASPAEPAAAARQPAGSRDEISA
jgi:hypothetical protein